MTPVAPEPALLVPPPALLVPPTEFWRAAKGVLPPVPAMQVGNIIVLATLLAIKVAEMELRLKASLKKKIERDLGDKQRVIRVNKAIDCVEDGLRDPKVLVQLTIEAVGLIVGTGEVANILTILTNNIAKCIRENALQQKNPRIYRTAKFHPRRPA